MAATRLFRYIALGDSTSVGVGAQADGGFPERLARKLKTSGVPVGILNLAVSGATTDDVVRGQVARAAAKEPDLVTVGIGGNDVWRLVPEQLFAQRVDHLATALGKTGAEVVVCNIADLGLSPAATVAQGWVGVGPAQITARIVLLNRHLDALAARPRFHVVDLFGYSRRELPGHPEFFSPDGFHPSARGYDSWAETCWPAVSRVATAWSARAG
jgi:acyl-CoA thioesterase-1